MLFLSKIIIKGFRGNVTLTSLDVGEEIEEKLSPLDAFLKIVDGGGDIVIDDKLYKFN